VSNGQDLEQVIHIRGAETKIRGNSVIADNDGNIFAVGYFENTAAFGTAESIFLTSEGFNDIFVAKFAPSGEVIWAERIGAESNDLATSAALDDEGNVYIVGSYEDTLQFATPGIPDLPGEEDGNILVVKMDTNGDVVWASGLVGPSLSIANSVEVDSDGNVLTTGRLKATIDFDPGAGEFLLSSQGIDDVFISKLDSDGNFVWAKAFLGPQSNIGRDLDVDSEGSVYITGILDEVADFDPGPGVFELDSGSDDAVFIVKLNSQGELVWAQKIAGGGAEGQSVVLDNSGNILIGGRFSQIQDFDPGNDQAILTSAGSLDGFILKLTNEGDYLWSKRIGGTFADNILALDKDNTGNVYCTGFFSIDATYTSESGEETIIGAGNRDALLTKLSPEGEFLWAFGMGGSERDEGLHITVDQNATIYTIGAFEETAEFDEGSASLTSEGDEDGFITIHTQVTNTVESNYRNKPLKVFPNPSKGIVHLSWDENIPSGIFEVIDAKGKIVLSQNFNTDRLDLDLRHLEDGFYVLRLTPADGSQNFTSKLILEGAKSGR
jgi:hypothetical protein